MMHPNPMIIPFVAGVGVLILQILNRHPKIQAIASLIFGIGVYIYSQTINKPDELLGLIGLVFCLIGFSSFIREVLIKLLNTDQNSNNSA